MRDSMIAAMEWFLDEFDRALHPSAPADPVTAPVAPISPGTEDLHRDLEALVASLARFPIHRVFRLRDFDSPYLLSDVLRAFSARAAAYKADRSISETERAALAPSVDAMVTRARSITSRLDAMLSPAGTQTPERLRLPPGAVMHRLINRR